MPTPAVLPSNIVERPPPPETTAKAYFIQSYDVKPGQLAPFQAWWQSQGAKRFLAFDGLLSVDTYVDLTRGQQHYTSLFGFRDGAAMQNFSQDPAAEILGGEFDSFIGEHSHVMQSWPSIYRVATLSTR
jgi:hypothetical protein